MTELLNLENIDLFDGNNKESWQFFLKDINNESFSEKIVESILNTLTNQPQKELTLDIVDYIIDFGCPKIISLIAQKNFLDAVLNLLKSETKAGEENQKKVIYLTQKWAKKFSNNNELGLFQENYNMLKNSGIIFPDESFSMDTYKKFTGEIQQNQNPPQQNIPPENNQINNNENQQPKMPNNPDENNQNPPQQEEGFPSNQNIENNNQGQSNNMNQDQNNMENKNESEVNPYEQKNETKNKTNDTFFNIYFP